MKVAMLYPQFGKDAMSKSIDVLGYDLSRSLSASHDVTMLGWRGSEASYPDQPIHFLATQFDHGLNAANRVMRGLSSAMRRPEIAGLIGSHLERYGRSAGDWIARHDVDIAHVMIYDVLLPYLAAAAPDTHLILHVHDYAQIGGPREKTMKNLMHASLILTCSDHMADELKKTFPALSDKIESVPNSVVDRGEEGTHESGHRIAYVGRISPEKGIHTLVTAFNEVADEIPSAELLILGYPAIPGANVFSTIWSDPSFRNVRYFIGPGRDSYVDYVRSLIDEGKEGGIRFAGSKRNEYARQAIAASDVLAFPPIWHEPFGLPVLEAMASSKPVVATRSGALPSIVEDQQSGFIVDRGDAKALARSIIDVLADDERARTLGERGRRTYEERFNWSDYVDRWHRVYEGFS